MPRAQIEIDIPDGYELVRIASQYMEPYSDGPTEIAIKSKSVVIIRKAWQWPSWLKCDWAARNKSGRIALGKGHHSISSEVHCGNDGTEYVDESFLELNLPPCTDWRQSLRLNPNREVKS